MKKILLFVLAAVLVLGCLSGCGSKKESSPESPSVTGSSQKSAEGKSLQIVTTIFPIYDWVINILGDDPQGVEVTMLLDKGVDLHNYQPTVDDVLKVSSCDMFIYVGGESDEWAEDMLKETANKDMVVINLLELLGDKAKEEEAKEGMQEEEEEEEEDGHEEEVEYDEHVWLSVRNAAFFLPQLEKAIVERNPENAAVYQKNAAAFVEELEQLDAAYEEAVNAAAVKTLLFGDRFPFRYLVDDYGLDYFAAFVGCSAETEASFETITFLAKKVDELGLSTVLTIEGTDHRIAETIIQNTAAKDQKILTMDSLQSVTAADVENGADYLSIMKNNLDVLKEALK